MPAAGDSGADYLAVGHVTVDAIADADEGPRRQPGGGAFYSALQASRLGLRARILTAGVERELRALLEPYADELEVEVLPAQQTTTLETHGSGADRTQRIVGWAGPLPAASGHATARAAPAEPGHAAARTVPATCAPSPARAAPAILHLAPIARELTGDCGLDGGLVGLTPQGLVRRWVRIGGPLLAAPLDAAALPPRLDAVVLSESERVPCAALLSGGEPRTAPVIAVTAGAAATSVLMRDGTSASFTPPAISRPADDLGAGDVFAAAFFVALSEGRDAGQAAVFANAAAAVRVRGRGPNAIGSREAIEALTPQWPQPAS